MIKFYCIKTNIGIYISDCEAFQGYDYDYHNSKINKMLFNGIKADKTFEQNWYYLKEFPTKIEIELQKRINERYDIKDDSLITEKLLKSISLDDYNNSEEYIQNLYTRQYDHLNCIEELKQDVDYTIEIISEFKNFEKIKEFNYQYRENQIFTNKNVQHQFIDKILFPPNIISYMPCKISSKDLFDITRQYIKFNIDPKNATITSDYDFCFTVKKIVKLLKPKTITYHNIMARTKKQRNKIIYKDVYETSFEIFEMTHDERKYQGYTPIDPIYADNENQLKEKIDEFLMNLIDIINKPIEQCERCQGKGYKDK